MAGHGKATAGHLVQSQGGHAGGTRRPLGVTRHGEVREAGWASG